MKKRIGGIFLATVLVLSLLTACGGSAGGSSGSKNSAAADMAPAAAEDSGGTEYGFTGESVSAGGAQEDVLRDAKMIRTANLEMETTAFDEAVEGLGRLTKEMGGYYEDSSLRTGGSGYRWADYTVRVPAENYDEFLSR